MTIKRQVLKTGKEKQQKVRITFAGKTSCYLLTVEPLFDAKMEIKGMTGCMSYLMDEQHSSDSDIPVDERLTQG